jgi:hypothetical protein
MEHHPNYIQQFSGLLQEKVDTDKKEEHNGKPDWLDRIRSLSKLKMIVGKFCCMR